MIDAQLKTIYKDILNTGSDRKTRTGLTRSLFGGMLRYDFNHGFPAVTSKKLAWQSVVGELLWFLAGHTSIPSLKHYTFGDMHSDKWTIWTGDAERWGDQHLGEIYGAQWTHVFGYNQITKLIKDLKTDPYSRKHIVTAWNPKSINERKLALSPCHSMFQCYVTNDNKLWLSWNQVSSDAFLGLPFNIASYALLTHLLARWTGYEPGGIVCQFGDVHIYHNHFNAVTEYINNHEFKAPELKLPSGADSYIHTWALTALDFKDSLVNYNHSGAIKAPLSVGK